MTRDPRGDPDGAEWRRTTRGDEVDMAQQRAIVICAERRRGSWADDRQRFPDAVSRA